MNLDLLHQNPREYTLKSRSGSPTDSRSVEQRIRNVRAAALRRIIDAIPPFELADVRVSWAHFVSLMAGRHPWPDANHRTGVLAFSLAAERALSKRIYLAPEDAFALVGASKAMRDKDFVRAGRYYSIDELSRPDDPYRRLFQGYGDRLLVEDIR